MKAASNNERTLICVIITPGFVCEQTLAVETAPENRPTINALITAGIANSFAFDWQVRQRVTTSLSNYILAPIPLPSLATRLPMLAHSSLRLSCNHSGYALLWTEQLGDTWREPKQKHTWPALDNDEEQWPVRAAIDALVGEAYGFTREQYEHVLSSFSHKSYSKAPEMCLARFDELKSIGLDAFTKKHDPYWDIPLNENLPKPVIELPVINDQQLEIRENGATYVIDRTGQASFLSPDRISRSSRKRGSPRKKGQNRT